LAVSGDSNQPEPTSKVGVGLSTISKAGEVKKVMSSNEAEVVTSDLSAHLKCDDTNEVTEVITDISCHLKSDDTKEVEAETSMHFKSDDTNVAEEVTTHISSHLKSDDTKEVEDVKTDTRCKS
jgi:phage-related protein